MLFGARPFDNAMLNEVPFEESAARMRFIITVYLGKLRLNLFLNTSPGILLALYF
jgi:hypothetical protein